MIPIDIVERDINSVFKTIFKTGKYKINLFGVTYLLVGDMVKGGAIATEEQYENCEDSFAHLYRNGQVKRYGAVIGARKDIEVLEALS